VANKAGCGRLDGKVALVTGAARSRGMGFAVAKRFAEEGAKVFITDMNDQVQERAAELRAAGYPAVAFTADLSKADQVNSLVAKVREQAGTVSLLCNVAGMSVHPRPPFVEMTEEYWDRVQNVNVKTAFNVCKAVVPGMIEQKYGKIVNWSSITGNYTVYRYSAAYASAKGAIRAFTMALALELGEHNISVNAILPGEIDSMGDQPWTPDQGPTDLRLYAPHLASPFARPGSPSEVANLALFLCSDESTYITGTEVVIDGGRVMVEPCAIPITFKR
jgi:NAD(P)-dependent dehydrogenase (short-subunit alcohol dehydrogenase family)